MKLSRKMKKQLKTKIISTTLAVGTVVVLLFACSKIDIVMDKIVPIILQRDTKIALLQNTIEEEGTSDGINLKITGVSDNGVKTIQVYQESTKVADYTYSGNTTEKQEDVKVSIPFGETANIIVKVNGSVVAQKQVTNMRYISTAQDLCNFRDIVNAGNTFEGQYVELTNNIDLSSVCSETLGSWTPIGATGIYYAGNFNGNYYTIGNLYISERSSNNKALFAYNSGTIYKLYMNDTTVYGKKIVAGLVAQNYGIIEKCFSEEGTITGSNTVGGLVSQNYGTVRYSINNFSVICNGDTVEVTAGGVVCTSAGNNGIVYSCINKGYVYAKVTSDVNINVGGVVGYCLGIVEGLYNTGKVEGIGTRKYTY